MCFESKKKVAVTNEEVQQAGAFTAPNTSGLAGGVLSETKPVEELKTVNDYEIAGSFKEQTSAGKIKWEPFVKSLLPVELKRHVYSSDRVFTAQLGNYELFAINDRVMTRHIFTGKSTLFNVSGIIGAIKAYRKSLLDPVEATREDIRTALAAL